MQKILDYLQGSGHTETIAHYSQLLAQAFLVVPIYKYAKTTHKTKKSLPKWVLPNQALIEVNERKNAKSGFVFENLIGGHLLNLIYGKSEYELQYYRENKKEVDFILVKSGEPLFAIEVKSARRASRFVWEECPVFEVDLQNIEIFLDVDSLNNIPSALN